ncbi:aminopeptidase O-like [Dendronephthya gigantea]|nr:aminopeptidase O-like [Dendronephthya gigantea]
MAIATLTQLDNCYHFADKNAEVRHRWCELVVKHSYYPGYPQVKKFLIEDQGMGIYLFGELLISQQPKQKQLVLDVLSIIDGEMDQCTLKTVQDMLEGRD